MDLAKRLNPLHTCIEYDVVMGSVTDCTTAEDESRPGVAVCKNGEMEHFDGEGSWKAEVPVVALYTGDSAI